MYSDELFCAPSSDKSGEEAYHHLNRYEDLTRRISLFYSDGSGELNKAVKLIGWNHSKSVVGLPVTSAGAENAIHESLTAQKPLLNTQGLSIGVGAFPLRPSASTIRLALKMGIPLTT